MTTFYLGDCLEIMKDLSDGSVHCFVCDLPYGQLVRSSIGEAAEKKKCFSGNATGCDWDVKLDLKKFWEQVKRLANNDHTHVLMFCNTKFGIDLINSNPEWFRYDLVWNKERGISFLMANKMPMKSHEMIYVFSKTGAFYKRVDISGNYKPWKSEGIVKSQTYGPSHGETENDRNLIQRNHKGGDGKRCPLSVIQIKSNIGANKHPTEKPEELYEWLLRRYVPDGGTVLDPTAGSFNSCFVADRLGYTAIGIEKNEAFFDKAVKRLNG